MGEGGGMDSRGCRYVTANDAIGEGYVAYGSDTTAKEDVIMAKRQQARDNAVTNTHP